MADTTPTPSTAATGAIVVAALGALLVIGYFIADYQPAPKSKRRRAR